MAQKRRDMKNKKQKPTNKELLQEINYLGNMSMQNGRVIKNVIGLLERYIEYKGDTKEFTDMVKSESEERQKKSVKDILDSQSSSKKEEPKKAKVA
jgi:hypothetical protein